MRSCLTALEEKGVLYLGLRSNGALFFLHSCVNGFSKKNKIKVKYFFETYLSLLREVGGT